MTRRPARRGVTLIETLVVLGLIALFASIVALNAPPPRAPARLEAERFAARLDAAFAAAVASGAPVRLDIDAAGWSFRTFDESGWTEPKGAPALAPQRFGRDVAATVLSVDASSANERAETKDKKDATQSVVIDPLGGDGATVAFAGGGARWIVTLDPQGAVTVTRDAQ